MTWVIGRAGPFGYATGISDIRVTILKADGKTIEIDCLQKIHLVSPGIVLGFAGSVKIGLEIVEELSSSLNSKPDVRWNPAYLAEWLPIGTKKLFNKFPKAERAGGCELILLSAHPKENEGDAPWAKCYVYTFRSPEFKPVVVSSNEIVSIGSGEKKKEYTEALHSLSKTFSTFELEAGITGGAGLGLMMSITSAIRKAPTKGVSTHLQVCIVGRDETKLGNNNITMQEHPEDNFIMPRVAQNWDEFKEIVRSKGISLSTIELAQC